MTERIGDGSLVVSSTGPIPETVRSEAERWARKWHIELGPFRSLGSRAADQIAAEPSSNALADLRHRFSAHSVDANWIPAEARQKQVLVSDMDSTIIPVECFDEVAEKAGVGNAVRELTSRAMGGHLAFADAYRARLALCRGVPVDVLEWVWSECVSLNPGAETLVRTMVARGATTVLVTGGFRFFAERVAARAGFREVRANDIGIERGRMTGTEKGPILDGQSKRAALEETCRMRDVPLHCAVAIGDGANDAAMLEIAGLGVAWRAKPALRSVADAILDYSDLDAVLSLQGIPATEHVAPCA